MRTPVGLRDPRPRRRPHQRRLRRRPVRIWCFRLGQGNADRPRPADHQGGGGQFDQGPIHADRGERLHRYLRHQAVQPGSLGASRRAVQAELVKDGVPANAITIQGFGDTNCWCRRVRGYVSRRIAASKSSFVDSRLLAIGSTSKLVFWAVPAFWCSPNFSVSEAQFQALHKPKRRLPNRHGRACPACPGITPPDRRKATSGGTSSTRTAMYKSLPSPGSQQSGDGPSKCGANAPSRDACWRALATVAFGVKLGPIQRHRAHLACDAQHLHKQHSVDERLPELHLARANAFQTRDYSPG